MAICEICRQEMSSSDGCLTEKLYIDENWYKRLSVMTECCPDCGAKKDSTIILDVIRRFVQNVENSYFCVNVKM